MVSPPFFVLKGFPRYQQREQGKCVWKVPGDSGNPALTHALSGFKDDLRGGVKVQYNKDGAIGEGTTKVTTTVFIQVCIFLPLGPHGFYNASRLIGCKLECIFSL